MSKKANLKWRSILGLLMVWIAVWFNLQWVWSILFLLWVIPDLISGVTYFMEPITREEEPLLFWAIMISWLVMCGLMILPLFMPEFKYY